MRIQDFFEMIPEIPILNIIRYLELQGWHRRLNFPNEKLIVFDGPLDMNREEIQAVIPANESFKDYRDRVAGLIYSLSEIEERPVELILKDMINPNVDRLQVRVISEMSKDGTLPLTYAANLVNSLKDFLVAAACAEENPQPFYHRATKTSFDYINSCRFGQTNIGSFIINIESLIPTVVEEQLSLLHKEDFEHFNRRVIKRVQKGLGYVKDSIKENEITLITNYETGFNANMCEALLSLGHEKVNFDLEYSVDWSIGIPKPTDVPDKVKIGHPDFVYLENAARVLRGTNEVIKKTIKGKILKLAVLGAIQSDAFGKITVCTKQDNKNINFTILLNSKHYKIACNAHRDNAEICAVGLVEKIKNKWEMTNPETFVRL